MIKYCALFILQMLSKYWANLLESLYEISLRLCKHYAKIVQIFCKYHANIVKIFLKYFSNISQILYKYIIQIFFGLNRAIQEHTRLNRAKCYPLCHFVTFSVKFQFIELLTQLKMRVKNIFLSKTFPQEFWRG